MDPVSVSIILTTIGWLAKPIFNKAVNEAWKQFTKAVGLDAETDELIAELKSFKVPMETAETTDYLKDVKELVNEARDLLDELDYFRLQKEAKQMNKAKHGNILPRFKSSDHDPSSSTTGASKELKFDKRGMSKRMKDLIKKLRNTCASSETRLEYQLLSSIAHNVQNLNNQAVPNDRQTTSYLFEKLYGRDDEMKQIEHLINNAKLNSEKVPVIAMVGNGGAGKTTLAKQVYNDPPVTFDLKIWICVSTNFDEMRITRQMLECCFGDGKRCDGENLDNLKSIVSSKLKGKKVLLVLDDIWEIKSKSAWDLLLASLNPSTGTMAGTVVLVTTRFLSIAKTVEAIDPVVRLDGMDESSFWYLFKSRVFGNDQYDVPYVLENIGRRIVDRLRGYPLAAKTVGALLKDNTDALYWTEVLESEQWKFVEGKDDIMPTLRLSYNYLPVHLKQCFSCCSLFPKDHCFKADELVYMWMVQDFINTNDKRVEDAGVDYLNELVERAFFQKHVLEDWGIVYVIHDLMHDLAQAVSKDEFLAINRPNPSHSEPYPSSLRHLSCLPDADYTIENHVQFQNLSSLVIFENDKALKDNLDWGQVNRVRLRLLILPYVRSISYNFTYFLHLCYLKLNYSLYSNSEEEKAKFPVQICKLYHLQVLELEDKWQKVKELPKDFNNLVNLRHFIANGTLHSNIAEVGRLKHLQELKEFVVRGEKGFELSQISELKELRGSLKIGNLKNVKIKEEAECVKLSEKKIVNLTLSWNSETEDIKITHKKRGGREKLKSWLNIDGRECQTEEASPKEILEALRPNNKLRDLYIENYGGCNSPSWLSNHSIKYLESIRLSNCEALEELPNFGQLMGLKELYLVNLHKVKAIGPQFHGSGCEPHVGFPYLNKMVVYGMTELQTWVWHQQYKNVLFPCLESLSVERCPKLREFSFFNMDVSVQGSENRAEWFPKLHSVEIRECLQLQQVPPIIRYNHAIELACFEVGFGSIGYDFSSNRLMIRHVKDPEVLDLVLKSFKNIRSMKLLDCPNLVSVSWKCICMLHSLKKLEVVRCDKLGSFPTIEEEKKDGRIFYLHESLEDLCIHECGINGRELSYLLTHLPAIRMLSVEHCDGIDSVSLPSGILSGEEAAGDEVVDKLGQQQPPCPDSLACFEELCIKYCPNMVLVNEGGLSELTTLTDVTIHGSDKLLHSMNQSQASNYVQTLKVADSCVTSLNLRSFVALEDLDLSYCEYLAAVDGPLNSCPAVFIKSCPQLAETVISSEIEPKFLMPVGVLNIDNIQFLSFHAHNFSMSLRSLIITTDEEWTEWTEELENALIKHLPALQQLTLHWCYQLSSLPGMLHLHPSLEELTLDRCYEVKSLPERGLPKSLQKLSLANCSEELNNQCSQLEHFECSIETNRSGGEVRIS